MSRKFYLVQDRDQDGFFASIKRHIAVLVVIVLVLFLAFAVVTGSYAVGVVKSGFDRQQRIEASAARLAEQQRMAEQQRVEAAQARVAAAAQLAKGDAPVHKAALRSNTVLRAGAGPHYDVVGVVKKGLEVGVVARTYPDSWYLLDDGFWIDGDYLSGSFTTLLEIDPPVETVNDCKLVSIDC